MALLLAGAVVAYTDHDAAETLGFLGIVVGQFVAGTLVFRRSRELQRRERNAWRFFGAALFLAATGVLVVGILTELGIAIPAFGWTDIFFLSGYAMLFVTFIRLARADGGGTDWLPTLIDALMGGLALAVLVWTNFFQDLLHSFDDAALWELAIAAAYPIMDIAAAVGLMILIIRRSNFHMDVRLTFLAIGISTQVVADFIFFSSGVGKTFAEAEPQFGLLLVATACYLMVGALVDRVPNKREFPEQAAPIWAVVWPYLLVAGLVTAHISSFISLSPTSNEVLLLSASLLIGVI
ncbi:MAG: hypothetical protein ACR2NL_00830, partial [Acidimicrobiia bacterium]